MTQMDLLNIIRQKSKSFANTDSAQGIEAIILHIEAAENHFEKGRSIGEYLFTDVIYRTNQAFEGALKEAYRVMTGNDPSRTTPFEIERYLEEEKLLKERVLSLFTNYRTEWRNKSTHDYQLFFSPQEALLAIVSISAFCNILLDQMLEKHAHDEEQRKLRDQAYSLSQQLPNYESLDFTDQCVELLKRFALDLKHNSQSKLKSLTEYELLGRLAGFITQLDPEIHVSSHKVLQSESSRLILDLILRKGDRNLVVEVKRAAIESARRAREGLEQMKMYLSTSGLSEGIVFVIATDDRPIVAEKRKLRINERLVTIVVMQPRKSD